MKRVRRRKKPWHWDQTLASRLLLTSHHSIWVLPQRTALSAGQLAWRSQVPLTKGPRPVPSTISTLRNRGSSQLGTVHVERQACTSLGIRQRALTGCSSDLLPLALDLTDIYRWPEGRREDPVAIMPSSPRSPPALAWTLRPTLYLGYTESSLMGPFRTLRRSEDSRLSISG